MRHTGWTRKRWSACRRGAAWCWRSREAPNMMRPVHGMVKLAIAFGLVAVLVSRAAAQSTDELYAAARNEGVVEFAGAMKQKETQEILKVFEQRYPGIRVTYTRRSTEPMVQLIEANRL